MKICICGSAITRTHTTPGWVGPTVEYACGSSDMVRSKHCYVREIEKLKEALKQDRSKWSLDTLLYVACELLKEPYPRHSYMIPAWETGQEFVAALRDKLLASEP